MFLCFSSHYIVSIYLFVPYTQVVQGPSDTSFSCIIQMENMQENHFIYFSLFQDFYLVFAYLESCVRLLQWWDKSGAWHQSCQASHGTQQYHRGEQEIDRVENLEHVWAITEKQRHQGWAEEEIRVRLSLDTEKPSTRTEIQSFFCFFLDISINSLLHVCSICAIHTSFCGTL
jgi:hypothetical protein